MTVFHEFELEVAELRGEVVQHPVFARVGSVDALRLFMQSHVFAVWDFMSLVKTLQNRLTCTTVPWLPPADARVSRFINEIVLGEESDEVAPGEVLSHFELYLRAMREAGANTGPIGLFVERLRGGQDLETCLRGLEIPGAVPSFVRTTIGLFGQRTHEVAAAFLYGREDVIPDMFLNLLRREGLLSAKPFQSLRLYLERHIVVDGDAHGPMARKVLEHLCGQSRERWSEAQSAARTALQSRKLLWDGIAGELGSAATARGA